MKRRGIVRMNAEARRANVPGKRPSGILIGCRIQRNERFESALPQNRESFAYGWNWPILLKNPVLE